MSDAVAKVLAQPCCFLHFHQAECLQKLVVCLSACCSLVKSVYVLPTHAHHVRAVKVLDTYFAHFFYEGLVNDRHITTADWDI